MDRLKNSMRSERRARLGRIAAFLAVAAIALAGAQFAGPAEATFKGRPGLVVFDNFLFNDCDDVSIYLARPDMTHRRLLTAGSDANFSPDGRKLIFNRHCGTEADIWEVNVDGSNPHLLISGIPAKVIAPSYSPDGRRIVFLKKAGPRGEASNYDVWTAMTDGTGQRQLTRTKLNEQNVSWSPNGRYILYTGGRHFLRTIRPDGTRDHRLTRGRQAGISPDGRSIAFVRAAAFHSQLCVIRPGSGKVRVVAQFRGDIKRIATPVFSPRGDKILYSREAFDQDFADVWSVAPDGSGKHRVRRTPSIGEHRLDWQAR